MLLNADFMAPVSLRPDAYRWRDSPVPGVRRVMLDRIGDEVARATSLVRYAPNSIFPSHEHGGGEEILVLEGEFADEHGRYPVGSYLRNPAGSRHRPSVGPAGALLFVKLHQFAADDTRQCVLRGDDLHYAQQAWPGLREALLHQHGQERVVLQRWDGHACRDGVLGGGGNELLVLDGLLCDECGAYPPGSWLRLPPGMGRRWQAGPDGLALYLKTGHLPPGHGPG